MYLAYGLVIGSAIRPSSCKGKSVPQFGVFADAEGPVALGNPKAELAMQVARF